MILTEPVARPTTDTRPARPPFAAWPVLAVAATFLAVELALAARYGFHRDELYFLACARHLALGYVDQPPLVPLSAWLSTASLGSSAVAMRVAPALAAATAVVLSACLARELGGQRRAQVFAALASATSLQVLAAGHVLATATFELPLWALITWIALRLLRGSSPGWWLALGVTGGIALENKYNVVYLLVALVVGAVAAGRGRLLLGRWPAAAAAIMLALWAPNLVWNATHGWPAVAMLQSLHQENSTLGASIGFIPSQLLVVGPFLAPVWLAGLRTLWRDERGRVLALAYVALLVAYTLSGAKPYYLAGIYFVLFAAGGVWAERRLAGRPRAARALGAWLVAGAVVFAPLTLPVLPVSAMPTSSWESKINKDLSATVGWRGMVRQLAAEAATLPAGERAHLVVLTGDYGAAGAVDEFGAPYGLPHAISDHNSYWMWGPAGARTGATTLAVNEHYGDLTRIFAHVTLVGSVATPHGVWTEERGDPIWLCRGQRITWQAAWPTLRHYG